MKLNQFEIDRAVKSMTVLVDTREQDTPALRQRVKTMGCPATRRKLDYGDYSAICALPNGSEYTLEARAVIERKMGLDELCNCYTKGRGRFEREFERAQAAGARVHLLIENCSIEKVLAGNYRSRFHPNALLASMVAWTARYGCIFWECRAETSGRLIKEILLRELKEALEALDYEPDGGAN